MTAHELARRLLSLPDTDIRLYWDGAPRGEIEGIAQRDHLDMIYLVSHWGIYRENFTRDEIMYDATKEQDGEP